MIRLIPDATRLNRRERALAARATAWLLLARVALRALPFGAVRGALHRIPRRRRAGATAAECERAVRRAVRALPSSRCLAQACAGAALLRREGRESLLTIHVNVADGRHLDAHASLLADGVLIAGGGTGLEWPVLMRERIRP
jgi:Transglutaminase-like superfamily